MARSHVWHADWEKAMHVLVSGASGLIGSALTPDLEAAGHRVTRLVRGRARPGWGEVAWEPEAGRMPPQALEGMDAVLHLAGESIAGRWTADKKRRIYDSRVRGTRVICEALRQVVKPPKTFVCASAIGYYGDRGERLLREESRAGEDFLARVCVDWEAAAAPAMERGIRVVPLRLGMVLSASGGALGQMLPPFRLGLGGRLGGGAQYVSWVTLDDVAGAILHVLTTESLHGAVNLVAPGPVSNRDFTRTLGRVLRRPTRFAVPALAARLLFGEMADALLLASTRVEPAKLNASGYAFRYPALEGALRHVLGKPLPDPEAYAAEPPAGAPVL